MDSDLPPDEMMRQLVDQLYDGQITDAGIDQIEALILSDQGCLQTYVEHLDFHSELVEQADLNSAEAAALVGMERHAQASTARESQQHRRTIATLSGIALLLVVSLVWMFSRPTRGGAPVGTVVGLSEHVVSDQPLELGQIVRRGTTVTVSQGIASIELPNVVINLVGPASLRMDRQDRMYLVNGTVVARVEQGGIGFSIATSDGEVVDLGTEFLVQHDVDSGTYVSVRRGEVQAKLLGDDGLPTKLVNLTASRAAQLKMSSESMVEVKYSEVDYQQVDRTRRGIVRISGTLRTIEQAPASLASDQVVTPNHMLLIPEQQVTLDAPLTVDSIAGPITIPAGTTLSSYLLHYDPTTLVSFAPRAAVTFGGEIVAVVGSHAGLQGTDSMFGLPGTVFEPQSYRELELEEDQIQLSDDGRAASFFFGVSEPAYLDEVRMLIVDAPAPPVPKPQVE